MKYKVNDRVRIKSIDWYNENKNPDYGFVYLGNGICFYSHMSIYCGKTMTISEIVGCCYVMVGCVYDNWTDEMIEELVEEENILNKWTGLKVELELSKSVIDVSNIESLHGERFMSGFVKAIIPPEGYIFKDENGNVINATKIVLEKKKKEYPKTYEECCKVMGIKLSDCYIQGYKSPLLEDLQELLICRDAYWKIAGDEMGLGKPWEPDWTNNNEIKFIIGVSENEFIKCYNGIAQYILAFPTEEMRDAFYENFKREIEICKELL